VLIFALGQHLQWNTSKGSISRELPCWPRLASVNIGVGAVQSHPGLPMDGGAGAARVAGVALPYSRATHIAAGLARRWPCSSALSDCSPPNADPHRVLSFSSAHNRKPVAQMKDITLGAPVSEATGTHWMRLRRRQGWWRGEALLRTSRMNSSGGRSGRVLAQQRFGRAIQPCLRRQPHPMRACRFGHRRAEGDVFICANAASCVRRGK